MRVPFYVYASLALGAGTLLVAGDTAPPVLVSPASSALNVSTSPVLQVNVSEPGSNGNLTVTFYGCLAPAGPDFTVVALPDTQYYSAAMNGGSPAIFAAQTDWCVSNRLASNIAYVVHLSDIVQNGDTNAGSPDFNGEWENATNALYQLENPVTTGLPNGIPYGAVVGNHEQSPNGVPPPLGTTIYYNKFFGVSHFTSRPYYGGHYGTNNDNHFDLFSASGLDFISVCLGYDTSADPAVLSWANNLLQTYSNRHALVASHYIGSPATPSTFGVQGAAIYNALRTNANLFLMVSGHVHSNSGEGSRTDVFNGHSVVTLVSDYQSYANGGDGWMRLMQFSPSNSVIRVSTYSPWRNQFLTDADSQFAVPMSPAVPPAVTNFTALGTNLSVSSGSTASFLWPVLLANRTYNWYVTVTDASDHTVTSPVWRFTTQPAQGSVLASDFALQMNGAYSYADLSRATTNLASVGDFTISGWFKIGNNGSTESPGQYLFRITNQESNTRRIQITETNGTITADIRATAAGAVYAVSSSAFSYDTWVHVAFVREGTQLRLYLNGQQVASRTAVITPLVVNRWAFLGANTYNSGIWGVPSNGFLGAIDEFQIWTVARTAQDIQNSMYRVIATAPGLFARWGFNEGTGTLAVDSSGNNGTATVNSAVWTRSMWEPVLHFTSDGARTTLSWDSAAAQLEAASSVTGPWSVPTGATSPYVVDRALNPKRFFRLRLGN